jgi:hypothetical protein
MQQQLPTIRNWNEVRLDWNILHVIRSAQLLSRMFAVPLGRALAAQNAVPVEKAFRKWWLNQSENQSENGPFVLDSA